MRSFLGFFMLFSFSFSLLLATPKEIHASKKKVAHCPAMAKKICKALGARAFFCGLYTRISTAPKVDQIRCRMLHTVEWELFITSLRNREAIMNKMKKLAKNGGPEMKVRLANYSKKLQNDALIELRDGVDAPVKRVIRSSACRMLMKKACEDIGKKSFYCDIFTIVMKKSDAKAAKCQFILENWATSQKTSYSNREVMIQHMKMKAGKDKDKLKRLAAVRKNQITQLHLQLK